jgi:exo-beta-1,3-glucanase (GH17 family)
MGQSKRKFKIKTNQFKDMKTGHYTKALKTSLWILLFGSLFGLFSCNTNQQQSQENMQDTNQNPMRDKQQRVQTKSDLIAGMAKAVCYSGFRSGQHPDRGDGALNPSYEEILEDLNIIINEQGFHLIRMYDVGENTQMTLKIIEENQLDMKVMLGVWLRAELSNHETCAWLTEPIPDEELQANKKLNLLEIEKGIELANQYKDIIVAVNVGNEALVDWNDHKVDTDTIISYVKRVQEDVDQLVTVADNYKWWADHGKKLAEVVDFVSLHIYPVWEGKDINEGMSYTLENFEEVRKTIPQARMAITEAGWATTAVEFGERASEDKQEQYYHELMNWAQENNITTFWFEAFDEDWKGEPGKMDGAEKHWGLYTVDRKPKKVMQ